MLPGKVARIRGSPPSSSGTLFSVWSTSAEATTNRMWPCHFVVTSTRAYSASSATASAVLPESVHGVVVQARSAVSTPSPSRSSAGASGFASGFTTKRTVTPGSGVFSSYPWAISCDESEVWQRGQWGVTRKPR